MQHKELYADMDNDFSNLLPLHYSFNYKSLPFQCEVTEISEGTYIVDLVATLGYLPYSSENEEKRCKMLNELGPFIAKGIVRIDHHCALTLPIKTSFKSDLTAATLMETITYTLLDANDLINMAEDKQVSSKEINTNRKSA